MTTKSTFMKKRYTGFRVRWSGWSAHGHFQHYLFDELVQVLFFEDGHAGQEVHQTG